MVQLFFDNASILVAVLSVLFNMTLLGVPVDVINEVSVLSRSSHFAYGITLCKWELRTCYS